MEPFLPTPAYHTPSDGSRSPLRRVVGAGAVFYGTALRQVFLGSLEAVRGVFDRDRLHCRSLRVFRAVERAGGTIHVLGTDRLYEAPETAVFVANHMRTLETFLFPCMIGPVRPLSFVVKESLVTQPVFGPIMRACDPVTVTRRNPRADLKAVLQQGAEKLNDGSSVVIFPQQTRSPVFRASRFNTLGVKLARRAGVPVVPIALKTDFWGTGSHIRDLGPVDASRDVYFEFGAAIDSGDSQRTVHGKVVTFLRERLQSWGVPCEE